MSSKPTDEWCTPEWLAGALGGFDLDPCSNARSHIRAQHYIQLEPVAALESVPASGSLLDDLVVKERLIRTTQQDGIAADWKFASVFCNPPYSDVMPWARRLAAHDGPWVALVKLDPTTKWWRVLMSANPVVAPFRRRIKFDGAQKMTANFPSVLVYSAWRPPAALVPHLWLSTYASEAAA